MFVTLIRGIFKVRAEWTRFRIGTAWHWLPTSSSKLDTKIAAVRDGFYFEEHIDRLWFFIAFECCE